MKKFIIGFLLGALLFSIIPASAAVSYVLQKSSAKLVVDGETIDNPALPMLNYKKNNYIPLAALRYICEKMQIEFQSSDQNITIKTTTPTPTPTPTPKPTPAPTPTAKEIEPQKEEIDKGYEEFKALFAIGKKTLGPNGDAVLATATYSGRLDKYAFSTLWNRLDKKKEEYAKRLGAEIQEINPSLDLSLTFYYADYDLGYVYAYFKGYHGKMYIDNHQLVNFKDSPFIKVTQGDIKQ